MLSSYSKPPPCSANALSFLTWFKQMISSLASQTNPGCSDRNSFSFLLPYPTLTPTKAEVSSMLWFPFLFVSPASIQSSSGLSHVETNTQTYFTNFPDHVPLKLPISFFLSLHGETSRKSNGYSVSTPSSPVHSSV